MRLMKICYVYDDLFNYQQNQNVLKGLEEHNIDIIRITSKSKYLAIRNLSKLLKFLLLRKNYDIIIVGMIGQFIAPIIAKLTKKPIIFYPFISLYGTVVEDRGYFSKDSLLGKLSLYLDRKSVLVSEKCILDTYEHIRYWTEDLNLPREKFERVFVGSNDEIFYPRQRTRKEDGDFSVRFYGSYIPAQGVEIIIEAANVLKKDNKIKFSLLGKGGPNYEDCRNLAKQLRLGNITFLDTVPLYELPDFIKNADVILGMFSSTKKFNTSIANKVYQAWAMKMPTITAESDGCKDLLVHRENAMLSKQMDPKSLAEAILELKNNPELRNKIAINGYKTFKENATPGIIAKEVIEILEKVI